MMLTAFLTSAAVVALAEIGDRTMLLAIMLVSRWRRPWPILAGILVATVANHLVAALIGSEVAGFLDTRAFRIAVALGFLAMAAWTLVPDKLDDEADKPKDSGGTGPFVTTVIAFFLAEIGDKTQIATMALAARFHSILPVAAGTTIGMMLANAPVVLLGQQIVARVSLKAARLVAAALFAAQGLWQLWSLLR